MCIAAAAIPLITAGVSAAASIGGAVMSANAQKSVAEAQMNAAAQAQQAQEQGFFQRMTAQQEQNARDFATQTSAISSENQAQAQFEAQQSQARAQREAQIQQNNQQTQDVGNQAQQLVKSTENQVTPESLAAAQQQQQAQIEALASPGTANIASGTSNLPQGQGPTAASASAGDSETQSAIATRLAQAAAATRQYTTNQAKVASYGAVPASLQNTSTTLGTAASPLAFQQKGIEAGQPAYLAPSTVSYQQAGNYYQNLLKAIQARTQGRLNVSNAIATGDITYADLQQADTATAAQNQAAITAWQAEANPLPGILSGIGNLGLYASGRLGVGNSAIQSLKSAIS